MPDTIKLLERKEYLNHMLKDNSMGTNDNTGEAIRKGMIPLEIKVSGDNTISFIISDGSIDRDHDTINVNGWNLTNYVKNPVVLWAHDHRSAPIAKGSNIEVLDDQLLADATFVTEDVMKFADMIFKLYKGGFMNAVSVGFMPDERVWSEDQGGIKFLTQELLEFSAVPVPANANALQIARSTGGIDIGPLKSWAEDLLDDWEEDTYRSVGASRKAIERMYRDASGDKIIDVGRGGVDPDKQKELRQRNIWEPRLKELRGNGEWNREEWGKIESLEAGKGPAQVPDYIWEEHLAIVAEKEAAVVDAERERVRDYLESYGEPSELMLNIAEVITESRNISELVETIGTDGVDVIHNALLDSVVEAVEGEMHEEDLQALLVQVEALRDEGIELNEIETVLREIIEPGEDLHKELTDQIELLEAERDLAVEMCETLVEELKESKPGVDPVKMIGMFGKALSESIRAITGRLPKD